MRRRRDGEGDGSFCVASECCYACRRGRNRNARRCNRSAGSRCRAGARSVCRGDGKCIGRAVHQAADQNGGRREVGSGNGNHSHWSNSGARSAGEYRIAGNGLIGLRRAPVHCDCVIAGHAKDILRRAGSCCRDWSWAVDGCKSWPRRQRRSSSLAALEPHALCQYAATAVIVRAEGHDVGGIGRINSNSTQDLRWRV